MQNSILTVCANYFNFFNRLLPTEKGFERNKHWTFGEKTHGCVASCCKLR